MNSIIQVYNYFFEVESYIQREVSRGETRRSLNNRAHTIVIGENSGYKEFEIEMVGLDQDKVDMIYKIKDYLYYEDNNEDSVELVSPTGATFDVIIPLPIEDSITVTGEEDDYTVVLMLEEKGGN